MKNAFCTITSQSHLFKTKALILSVKKFMEVDFYVLVVDGNNLPDDDNANYLNLNFLKSEYSKLMISKYRKSPNKLRWGLKPVLMLELLQTHCDKVIYIDNDIFFFSSPNFLFDKLNNSSIILSPHNCNSIATNNPIWFEVNYWVGLYNGGFLAASKNGVSALIWWSQCCIYNMSLQWWRGIYDDQKYLDLMPIVFEDIEILKHKGCNIAGWNLENCKRILTNEGVRIEPNYPVVFIHFTPLFFANIAAKKDELLEEYSDNYVIILKKFNPDFSIKAQLKRSVRDYFLSLRYVVWLVVRFFEK